MAGTQTVIREINDPLLYDHLLYPELSQRSQAWLQQSVNAPTDHLTQQGLIFVKEIQQTYSDMYDAARLRRLKEALTELQQDRTPLDNIYVMMDPIEFRDATPIMQRFVMANPEIRLDWQKQRLFGYEGSYVDTDPDTIEDDHYDYRRATNGIEMYTEKDGFVTKIFDEDLRPDDIELSFGEQIKLHMTWQAGNLMRSLGIDPTRSY